jgi:hypothetical protein
MQIHVNAPSDEVTGQVRQLLLFYLTGLEGQVERIAIDVDRFRDRLDTPLHLCSVSAASCGREFRVDEIQGDLVLAITRALDRTVRTLRRRPLIGPQALSA